MKGRHVRPRPNLLTRLRVVAHRVVTALAKVDSRQTQEVDMDGNGSGSGGGNSGN